MSDLFYWTGLATVSVASVLLVAFVALAAVALWKEYGPKIIFRRPATLNIWSSYRRDQRTGEGNRIKVADDIEIARLIGVAWRFKWFVGVITFSPDDGK